MATATAAAEHIRALHARVARFRREYPWMELKALDVSREEFSAIMSCCAPIMGDGVTLKGEPVTFMGLRIHVSDGPYPWGSFPA